MHPFIAKIKDSAIQTQRDFHILASVTIAQAILETGWGASTIGNNIFGIKASKSWTGATKQAETSEVINGKRITVTATFRDYPSITACIEDHAKVLTENSCYKNIIGESNYAVACHALQNDGYATDPNYADKLIAIINANNLTQFDNRINTNVKTLQIGSKISYAGHVFADSYGNGIGKYVNGIFTVDRYIVGRKYGAHISPGWIDCGPIRLL